MMALSRSGRGLFAFVLVFALLVSPGVLPAAASHALAPGDGTFQTLPFSQNWANIGLIVVDDDWSGVPGIIGFRGDNLTATTGTDPQTILADDTPGVVDVNANQTNPDTFSTGGVTEFHIANPVVALSGSGTADAPYLLIHLNTSGYQSVNVSYNLRDIDGSTDNAIQQMALHYRVGTSGAFTNVPGAYVADATTGPSQATLVTPVNVTLPASADNQSQVQLRVMTTNAVGNDEWVGIDDISITGTPISVDLPPTVTDVTPDNGATNVPIDVAMDITFSEPVTVTGTIAIACATSGIQNVTPTGGPTTFALPHTDFAYAETCTVTVLAGQVTDQDGTPHNMAANYVWSFTTASACGSGTITPIHDIQGTGASSGLIGQQHTIEAVVISDFQTEASIRGFFVQEPDADQDADPVTSEGLFIYDNNFGVPVAVGDHVRATGFVSEFQSQTQLSSISVVTVCSSGVTLPTASNVVLPFPNTTHPERFEGMSIAMTQTLTVNETFNLGRGGILTLANGRLQQPTNVVLPGAPANTLQAANNLNWITLDDGSLTQNPDPIKYPPPGLAALNTVRSGDSVSAVAGVLTQGNPGWSSPGILYRIHPFVMPTFTVTNPRPAAPNPVRAGGSLKISSFNVLNYFLTLDTTNTAPFPCGPAQNQECRGANTAQELTRQRDKLLQALYILNADVVGLMELENTPNVEPLQDIVNGLNALTSPGTYDFIDTGVIDPGDVIKVGIIYKPGVVQPVGDYAILNHLVDPTFISINRPTLAQTFQEIAGDGRFTVVVNHLKSKGCTGATGLDQDQGDGQSCFNYTRTRAANALLNWIAGDPTATGDPDFLIVGDLNSYAREDPIRALETAGYANLEIAFEGPNGYSYVFGSQAGSLDHSLANTSLYPQVNGATTWHINADEPSVLDYNTEFKSAGQIVSLYNADPYRTSDHDPLLIGLNLTPAQASIVVTKTVGVTPGVCATTDEITVTAGTDVYYCYAVANTGNLTLYLHDLADSELGSIFASLPYTLTPGSSVDTVAAGLEISATISATTVNDALWTAYNLGPIDVVTATATATVTVPPPNIFVDPLAIGSSQQTNTQTQHTLTISNTGGSDLDWQILEEPQAVAGPASQPALARFDSRAALADEAAGIDRSAPAVLAAPDPAARARAKQALLATGLLLVPDWSADRVMAFDPTTGNLVDANFIPTDSAHLASPKHAILSAAGNTVLVADQVNDAVHEYDLDGNWIRLFAPAGGVNNAILDNIRGISLDASGNLLVTVAGGANSNAIAKFDTSGAFMGNFIAAGTGGLAGPYDLWKRGADWLVSSDGSNNLLRYDLAGAFLNVFAPVNSFPQQIGVAGNSNVLVGNFSGTQEGVVEFTPAGVLVGIYDPAAVGGYRGAYELPNGNILTSNGNGVYEIDRSSNLVSTKITGASSQFIEYVAPQSDCTNPADIPWASTSPITGTTPAGDGADVTVTLDSTGLAPGVYSGNLCITSNDPDAGPGNGTDLVVVPLTLTVEEPTAVTLSNLVAAQAPLPAAGLPVAALPAAIGLALAAAYAMRRRR